MLSDFLYFSKYDRRSIVMLALLAVVCIATLLIMRSNRPDEPTTEEALPAESTDSLAHSAAEEQQPKRSVTMKEFDPNTVDSATLVSFGLSPSQARVFIRYRRSGAVFRTPESLSRVYTLSDTDLDRLIPYARIGDKYKQKPKPARRQYEETDTPSVSRQQSPYPEKFSEPTTVDPNTADTLTLQRIPGIGRWISKGIVEQRDRLGGFHSVSQLMEVKHFPEEALEWFKIDSSKVAVKKININKASFRQLNRHPYISYEQAGDLTNFIRLYGKIADTEALRRTGIFTQEETERLLPYLEF